MNRFKNLQIFGVILVLVALLGGFYSQFLSTQLHLPELFWIGLMLLGLFARSAGEAGALRLRNSDKAATMSRQDLIISLLVTAALMGGIVWLGK